MDGEIDMDNMEEQLKDAGFSFVVLYCNFRSLAFLGLLGFLIRQLKF